jgi:hypothetical protein
VLAALAEGAEEAIQIGMTQPMVTTHWMEQLTQEVVEEQEVEVRNSQMEQAVQVWLL